MKLDELEVTRHGDDVLVEWNITTHSSFCMYNILVDGTIIQENIEENYFIIPNIQFVRCIEYEIVVKVVNIYRQEFTQSSKRYERGNF